MTNFNLSTMTKKELLAMAAEAQIKGRSDMSKDDLIKAVLATAMNNVSKQIVAEKLETDEVDETDLAEEAAAPVEELSKRAEQTDDGPVAAEGSEEADDATLKEMLALVEKPKFTGGNKSGNVPYKRKPYYLDREYYDYDDAEFQAALAKAPNQVRLILKCMAENNITDSGVAMIGRDIVEMAKEGKYLTSTIPSANLFAYYRRELERFGVTFIG